VSGMIIHIRGLEVRGNHGVLPEERVLGQPFVIDLAMDVPSTAACITDDLTDTVNYAAVVDDVTAVVAGAPVALIECLARLIADCVLAHDLVQAVTVTVSKPQAPVSQPLDDVAVTLRVERERA